MTKKITSLMFALLSLLVLSILVPSSDAQTVIPTTTFSAAVTTTSTTTVVVSSATGIVANTTLLYADSELMAVNAVSGTTLSVTRGYEGTRAETHSTTAQVWVGPAMAFQFASPIGYPAGSCTRSNLLYVPWIDVNNNIFSDCDGGQWVSSRGNANANNWLRVYLPPTGAVLTTSINTAGTAPAANTDMYCSEIDVPVTKYATGLAVLNGTTVGTDKHLVILYDAAGNALANSATAGALSAGASTYQTYAFTSPYLVVGPAKYYACTQSNGVTDTLRMLITNVQDGVTTKQVTGQTFGTIAATITVPTTFTTAVGPYYQLY